MRAEATPGGPTQPSLTASCAIDPHNPSQYVISYSGSGFTPGRQVDLMIRGADEPRGSGDPFAPGGVTGSFSGSQVYRGRRGREVVIEVDRAQPPVEAPVSCPVLGGSGVPSLTASCVIDPDDPSRYVISYSGSGFQPGRQIDIMVRPVDPSLGSSDPLGPGGVTGSFSGTGPYSGWKGRELIVFVDRHHPPVEAQVSCPAPPAPSGRGCLRFGM